MKPELNWIKVFQIQCFCSIVKFKCTEYGIYLLFLSSRVKDPILGLVYLKERDTKDPISGQQKILFMDKKIPWGTIKDPIVKK